VNTFPELPLTSISIPATVRMIPTAYYKAPVLSSLVDDASEMEILAQIEGLTNLRLKAQKTGLSGLDSRELAYGLWGETHINAAFAYARAGGNRFNHGSRGAWYAALDDLTAIDEVAYHRTRELSFIGDFHDEAIYQVLLAGFIGEFSDARGQAGASYLGEDPDMAYPVGQALAQHLRDHNGLGLIYPSVRRKGGTCLVAFHPHLVQNVRPGARWKLTWDGSPEYTVTTD